MPKVAIFFAVILLTSSYTLTNSHASVSGDFFSVSDESNSKIFDSGIVDVDSTFFTENNFKRYLIFGTGNEPINPLKNQHINQIQTDNGFFAVSLLSENTASNLSSQGYYVIEDFKLDFHSSDEKIQDVSKNWQHYGF